MEYISNHFKYLSFGRGVVIMTDKSKIEKNSEVKKISKISKDIKIKNSFIITKDVIEDCLSTCLG
jgi:NDP-sugar pyrophosphorylase family protein